LRNWSYYELQQYITYKADKYGIEVRKITPYHTSQKCSCCGYVDSENRPKDEKGQAYFKCLQCGTEMNADFNAARNISMSTDFTK
jgi:transposase